MASNTPDRERCQRLIEMRVPTPHEPVNAFRWRKNKNNVALPRATSEYLFRPFFADKILLDPGSNVFSSPRPKPPFATQGPPGLKAHLSSH